MWLFIIIVALLVAAVMHHSRALHENLRSDKMLRQQQQMSRSTIPAQKKRHLIYREVANKRGVDLSTILDPFAWGQDVVAFQPPIVGLSNGSIGGGGGGGGNDNNRNHYGGRMQGGGSHGTGTHGGMMAGGGSHGGGGGRMQGGGSHGGGGPHG